MSAKDLVTCVDPCSGQARTSVPLLFRKGRGGLDLSLTALYDSGTLGMATRWNQDAPTGILGLGWNLPRDRVLAHDGLSAVSGDIAYALQMKGVMSPLVCTAVASDGTSSWATSRYMFWKITYDPGQEVWSVLDEDGVAHRFGDSTSSRGTVDWGVAWGDWSGPNGALPSQRAVAVGWSLSTVTDLFGNSLTYSYTQTQAQVVSAAGGLFYTQASYLSSIIGGDGSQILLQYSSKTADEYQAPHADPAPPNAWQDCFETLYLAGATLSNPSGQPLASVELGYGPTLLGSGTLTKRLLTSVTRLSRSGALVEPPTLFSYWGQSPSDNVSAASFQSGQALYGALKQVTSPLGGTLTYAYQATSLSYADRSLPIAPSPGATGWANPVVYATDAYILVTWLAGSTVNVQSYRWNGRWIPYDVMSVALGSAGYGALQVATDPTCCAVQSGGTVSVAARDASRPGAWFPAASFTLSPAPGATEATSLVAGRNFAAVLAETSGNLFPFRFTGGGIGSAATATGWVADPMASQGSPGDAFALAASGSLLAAIAVAGSGAATFTLNQLSPCGTWSDAQQTLVSGGLDPAGLSLELGAGFAVAWSTAAVPGGYRSLYASFWWSADGTLISMRPWPSTWAATAGAVATPRVGGTTVLLGQWIFRFTGTGWTSFSSGTITYPGVTGPPELSVGSDLVARRFATSGGGAVADLLVYDPIGGSWSVPTGMSVTSAGFLAAVVPRTSSAVANYAVIGTSLWFRSSAGTWTSVLTLPAGLSAADLATVELLGEDYLVFQQGTGTDSVSTGACLLQNGSVMNVAPITLSGQQIAPPPGSPGSLISRTGFAAFTGTFGSASSQWTLYRPVFGSVTGAQTGYVVAAVTGDNGYGSESGINGSISMAFGYQAGTVNGRGTVPLVNTVTAVPGQASPATPASGTLIMAYYTGLTTAETPATPYPLGAGNAAGFTQALIGTLYQSTATATATGSGNAQQAVSQVTLSHQVTLLPQGNGGVGMYDRYVQLTRMQDGASGAETLTYDPQTGFPASRSTSITNAAGTEDSFSEQFTYFYSVYDPTLALNLLSPVIQTVAQSQGAGSGGPTVTGTRITTWRDWSQGQGRWAPDRGYRALGSGASFAAWTYGQVPPAADFVSIGQVLALSPEGMVLETMNALGTISTVNYDQSQTYPVSAADNGAPQQALWYGCEPYESSGAWITTIPGQTLADALTPADFHTGTQSLSLAAGTPQAGPLLVVQPADQTRRYLFSCWAKAAATFLPANGSALWTLTLFNPTTLASVGSPIFLTLTPSGSAEPSAVGQWAYFQVTLDLPSLVEANAGNPLGISIQATNANTQQPCYVDELRFMPVDCTFAAFVYDPASFRTTATIDGAGQCTQIFHDNRDNSYLAVGPGGQVQGVALSTYARSTSSTGAFQSPFPNVTLSLDSAVGGAYESFNNPASGNWAFTNAAAWDFAGGKLVYSGSEAATATCTLFQAPNQAARVSVTPATAAGASVALGNGTYAMRWTNAASGDGTGAWTLEQAASGTPTILWTNSTAGFDSEWLFASIDGMVVAYAGPVQLFGSLASTGTPSAGAITLAATGASSFDDLAILQDPSLSLSARDGMGRPFSSLALLGYQPGAANVLFPSSWVAASAGTFYDALGRPAVSGQALNAPLQVTPALAPATGYDLIPQDQTTYLYSSQGSSLSLSAYLNGVDGFPFTQATFEASPLDRLVNVDAPRGAFTAGSVYCTVQTLYGSSSTVGDMPSAGAGAYRVVTRQALQQTTAAPSLSAPPVTILEQTTTDTAGRLLMRQSGPAGGALLQTGYGYNAAGQLSTIYLPNSYAPPAGTVAADWQESLAYDFLGRRISQTTPDSGTTQWAYDSLNRVRFIYTPNGAPVSPATTQTILYRKYDALDRIVESGYLRDSRYAWGGAALTAMLDVAAFPIIAGTPGGADQAAGMVSKATVFDTDVQLTQGPSFTQFLIGRPTQVTITPTDGAQEPDLETYTYDASGNVLTKTVLMPALSPPSGWTTAYTYDAGNRVLSVTYPPMTATAADPDPQDSPIAVGYGYDRLGRLAAVGGQATGAVVDPENPPLPLDMSYAGYAYDTFGHLVAAQYNNGGGTSGSPLLRSFSYDADERLASIADPYFSQTLTYDASSTLTGWSYFQSKVSTATSAYPGSALAPQPLPGFVQSFGYDGYGRLSSAQNSLGAAFSLTLGNGTADYDANGNILGMTQGASQNTYLYTPPAQSAPCNQVTGVSTSAVDDVDFTASPPALNGWSWASNNGGPSTSALTTTTPVQDGTQALKLAGGSAGHYEVLSLATFLTPGVSYLLTWSAATDSAYPVSPGIAADGACWYAVLNGPSGAVAVAPLGTVAGSSTAWLAGTLTLDLTPAGISRMTGTLSEVVWVSIELRNLCAGSSGAAGAAVYLKSAGLANAPGSTVAATYSYDPLGHVIAAPGRNLAALTYDPCTGLTASISIEESAATASTLAFVYGANNLRSRATLTPSAGSGGSVQRTLTVMGAHGELLATQTLSGGTVTATYYVNGVEGRPFAVLSSASPGAPNYLLTDRLGSLRAVVNGASGTLLAATDTQPFGAAQRTWGTTGTDISYTGQRRDAAAGLYNYNARLYDPALGRFLATDPAGQYASPYAYVGNDPVNAIDPTGEIWLLAQVAVQIAFILPYLLVNGPEFYGEVLRPLFLGIAKEHAETINTDPLPGEGIFGKYWRNVAKMSLKAFLQTIKNVSMKEMQIMADYDYEHWWLNPFKRLIYLPRALDTMVNAYRHIPKDVSGAKSWEKPPAGARYVPLEMANAARHVSFMCRNMRTLFGSPGYALALGDAHEGSGGSSTDLLATLDTISDKLNNAIAIYLTQSYPAVACVELFTENWWGGGGIFSLNNEGRDLTVPALLGITTGRVFTGESFQRSMDYLNNNGVALPAFTSKETAVIDNAMGRLST